MCNPILASSVPVTQPLPGHEYKIAGSAAFEHDGHTQNAVYLATDGIAFAGRVRTDRHGEYFEMAFDADDQRIEASPGWEACITGEIAGVAQTPATVGQVAA
jgi:hypothetical protein